MNRIFLTGDTHATHDIGKLGSTFFPVPKSELDKSDYLIILGDFGFIWDAEENKEEKFYLDVLENKPYTILWLDGNHENHERLASYPISEWHGGKVHFIRPHIIHLMRGEIYDINGETFFVMGGARSIDKEWRTEGRSWWPGEEPSYIECESGLTNLDKHNNKVDYILTHCAPTSLLRNILGIKHYQADSTTQYLEEINNKVDFNKWFMGHYHLYQEIEQKYYIIYNDIVELINGKVNLLTDMNYWRYGNDD